jgi:hypothetical protein
VLVIFVALLATLHNKSSNGPSLTRSCTTPAIALGSTTTGTGRNIGYTITGPATGTYVITVDADTATAHGRTADVTPSGAIAVAIHQGLDSCAAGGTLPDLASGPHQVELFRDGAIVAKAALR